MAAPVLTAHLRAPAPRAPALSASDAPRLVGRLDQLRARIRWLRTAGGLSRVVVLASAALVLLYAADRWLVLPRAVRGVLLVLVAGLLLRELWRRVGRALFRGPDRQDAARLAERRLPALEGRVISTLQLGPGRDGSLQGALLQQAEEACGATDLRQVLSPRPALLQAASACGTLGALLLLMALVQPAVGVFVQRWLLQEVPWPRATHLSLVLPERGPAHVRQADGSLVVARAGVLEIEALAEGQSPARVEVLVVGEGGQRLQVLGRAADGRWRGHLVIEQGDVSLQVRGGDDDGEDNALALHVVEPPRLDQPRFRLQPPAYTGLPESVVEAAGLRVPQGTLITVEGQVIGRPIAGELRLPGQGLALPLEVDTSTDPPGVRGSFVAEASDALVVVLTGEHELATPDPAHYALLVQEDRPPTLRVFVPARSDLKVSPRAIVPFAVLAEDDHGTPAVSLRLESGPTLPLVGDAARPASQRLVVDLAEEGAPVLGAYTLVAVDGRDLPGRPSQSAEVEGRRIDVVEEAELRRLLAERQLRLKEAYLSIRERQRAALEEAAVLRADPPAADDPDLVAAVVAQNQITLRLQREAKELCAVLDETLWNRLDVGPGAASLLQRRLADWAAQPLDEEDSGARWRALAADEAAGSFGTLDAAGRLLDMAALALDLVHEISPAAREALAQAQRDPSAERLAAAEEAQRAVDRTLAELLGRMDEWEDFQEVLALVGGLLEDQKALRARTQAALSGGQN